MTTILILLFFVTYVSPVFFCVALEKFARACGVRRQFEANDGGRRTMRVPARVYICAPQVECARCDDDMTVVDIEPTPTPGMHTAFYECPYCKATSGRFFVVEILR